MERLDDGKGLDRDTVREYRPSSLSSTPVTTSIIIDSTHLRIVCSVQEHLPELRKESKAYLMSRERNRIKGQELILES